MVLGKRRETEGIMPNVKLTDRQKRIINKLYEKYKDEISFTWLNLVELYKRFIQLARESEGVDYQDYDFEQEIMDWTASYNYLKKNIEGNFYEATPSELFSEFEQKKKELKKETKGKIKELEEELKEGKERLEEIKKEKVPPEYRDEVKDIKDRIDDLEDKLEGMERGGIEKSEIGRIETKIEGKFDDLRREMKELVDDISEEKKGREGKKVSAAEVVGGGEKAKPEIEISDTNKEKINLVAKTIGIPPDKFLDLIEKLLATRYLKNLTPWLILGVAKGLAQLNRNAQAYENNKKKAARLMNIKIGKQKDQINYASKQVRRATDVVRSAGFKFKR